MVGCLVYRQDFPPPQPPPRFAQGGSKRSAPQHSQSPPLFAQRAGEGEGGGASRYELIHSMPFPPPVIMSTYLPAPRTPMLVERIWTGYNYRNFNYLIACPDTGEALAIDPLDHVKCLAKAKERGWNITQVLNTHEHHDHTG